MSDLAICLRDFALIPQVFRALGRFLGLVRKKLFGLPSFLF